MYVPAQEDSPSAIGREFSELEFAKITGVNNAKQRVVEKILIMTIRYIVLL